MSSTRQAESSSLSSPANRALTGLVGSTIFFSRWLQAPLYLGLIVAQGVYVVKFWRELIHLLKDFMHLDETEIMLIVLGLVDVVMIANLLIMVIIGGYETFVSRINMRGHPDEPEWLSHVNPNVLKVKLAMSIIGISSIHLLKTFIEAQSILGHDNGEQVLLWQTVIHLAFIASAIGLAYIDRLMPAAPHAPSDH
ncbi:TIGR00645 family protein [Nocardioides humi]|uniref:TIGR00645 family protein n=1 Tax=Nocardioides humi TaxID=449461 RepID=UPI001C63C27D|nr:TIGR00645 family protein [Nocardioides humi]